MSKTKKKVSIRLKLIGIIVPIVLVLIVAFFVLATNMVSKISKEELLAQSQVYTEDISAWARQIFSELQVYQDTIEEGNFENDEEILKYLETTLDKNEAYPIGLYMGDDSGVYLDGSGWEPGDEWVLVERDWYVDGKDNAKFEFGEPYYDSLTGDVCVSASVLVDYSKATRVLATDVYLDYVATLMKDISEKSDVKAFLVSTGDNSIIAHPDTDMLAVSLESEENDSLYKNVATAINKNKSGVINLKGDDGKYYVTLNQVENTDWYLVTYITEKNMLTDLYKMEIYMAVIAVVAAIVLLIGILGITGSVVRPVKKVTNAIGQIADGDFTQSLEVSGRDEVAIMSNKMQMFITKMRSTIIEIRDTAEWLNKQSFENEHISDSLLEASESQIHSMELLNKLAEELSSGAEEAGRQMERLSELIKQTSENGSNAEKLMKESVAISQSGKKDMEHINNGMESINSSINTLSEQITNVGDTMSQISKMVSLIMDVADQTNLLALNASIEAARAGEAGKGFAVVADEIGKLATDSRVAADDISKLTDSIKRIVDEAVEHMNVSVAVVENNVGMVAGTKENFVKLYGKVEETSRCVEDMIVRVSEVDSVAEQMESIMDGQRAAVIQIVESAQVMQSSTENVRTDSNIVAESAEELKRESLELIEEMSKFTV